MRVDRFPQNAQHKKTYDSKIKERKADYEREFQGRGRMSCSSRALAGIKESMWEGIREEKVTEGDMYMYAK